MRDTITIDGQNFNLLRSNKSPEILFIPGFRSLAANGLHLLRATNKGYISFDLPGIASNREYKAGTRFGYNVDEIIKNVVKTILKKYDIKAIVGASLATIHIMYHSASYLSIGNKSGSLKILLLSPVLSSQPTDLLLRAYTRLTLLMHKVSKRNAYIAVDKHLWNIVWKPLLSNDAKSHLTHRLLYCDFINAKSPWVEYQFLTMSRLKRKLKDVFYQHKNLIKQHVHAVVGEKDKVISKNDINLLSSVLHNDHLHVVDSNHMIETEKIDFVSNLLRQLVG